MLGQHNYILETQSAFIKGINWLDIFNIRINLSHQANFLYSNFQCRCMFSAPFEITKE